VETRLKGYKYFEIERDFLNKLGVLIDGDFKLLNFRSNVTRRASPGRVGCVHARPEVSNNEFI
jgi:hypothetical protein